MAEFVNVKVTIVGAEVASSELIKIRSLITEINSTPVRVRVDSSKFDTATTSVKKYDTATKDVTKSTHLLGDSFDRIILKMAAWQILGNAIATVIRSFREAISTMKEVDQQLTNIKKVSDLTAREIERIGDAAYETASKYGVAAQEYLKAVYEFQKAGLGDSSEQMAELATKTMLVGDTSADVASKFLIAVNAAWELNGSISDLSRIVDEADFINNNYATTLEKISAGMPIVASTAANFGMSLEETMAALATITSKTQESGTKAATALRALIMNVQKEVGTIVDETGAEIEITQEDIDRLSDALRIYGNDAVKAAQDSGSLIDPMEVLVSLAQAYKDGLIDDQKLMEILMETGGKLRTNQLTTLVKDMASDTSIYYDILNKLPQAAGTADAEISTMLESWNAKTQILKNTWTEYISHLVDSKAIKAGIDALTGIIKFLDSDFGHFAVTVLSVSAAVFALTKAIPALVAVLKGGLVEAISLVVIGIQTGATAVEIFTAVWNTSPFAVITAIVGVVYGLVKLISDAIVTMEEARQAMADAANEYAEAKKKVDELNESLKKNVELLKAANDQSKSAAQNQYYKTQLLTENELLREQLETQLRLLEIKKRNELQAADDIINRVVSNPNPTTDDIDALTEAMTTILNAKAEGYDLLQFEMEALNKANAYLENYNSNFIDASTNQKIEQIIHETEVLSDAQIALAEASKISVEKFDDLKDRIDPLTKAYKELSKTGHLTESTWRSLAETYPELGAALDGTTTSGKDLSKELEILIHKEIELSKNSELVKESLDEISDSAEKTKSPFTDLIKSTVEAVQIAQEASKETSDWLYQLAETDLKNAGEKAIDTKEKFDQFRTALVAAAEDNTTLAKKLGEVADKAFPQFVNANNVAVDALFDTKGQLTDTGKAALDARDDFADLTEQIITARIEAAKTSYENLRKELKTTGDEASIAAQKLADFAAYAAGTGMLLDSPYLNQYFGGFSDDAQKSLTEKQKSLDDWRRQIQLLSEQLQQVRNYRSSSNNDTSSTIGGGGSTPKTAEELEEEQVKAVVEATKIAVSWREKELTLLQHQGASYDEQLANLEQQQKLHHDIAEYYRAHENETQDKYKKEILEEQNSWWSIEEQKQSILAQKQTDIVNEFNQSRELLQSQLKLYEQQEGTLLEQIDLHKQLKKSYEDQLAITTDEESQNKLRLSAMQEETKIAEILKTNREWLYEQRQKEREKLESELSLMEAQGQSAEQQLKWRRKIVDAIREQAAFTADDVEENKLLAEALQKEAEIEQWLTSLQEERINKLQESVDEILKAAQETRDSQIAIIDAQLEKLEKSRNVKKDQLTIEEKILAVQEAQAALANAQAERTVRYYNALTGQWEWGANASAVKSAAESLKDAQQALDEYYDDKRYERRKKVIEKARSAANNNYSTTESFWNGVIDAVKSSSSGNATNAAIVKVGADGNAPSGLAVGTQVVTGAGTYVIVPNGTKGANYNPKTGYSSVLIPNSATTHDGTYDSGGVLHGMGGIKATTQDEMVLPPWITNSLLNAESTGAFNALLNHLGIVTAAANSIAGFGGATTRNSIGSQHNGDVFEIGGVTISEAQARGMTVYDFAQTARTLALHRGA
ncbi:MAG: phage tail tape measure protein [Clostridia bacterium]|nr:phage tail tape measure protein [Clostridia bacterium]